MIGLPVVFGLRGAGRRREPAGLARPVRVRDQVAQLGGVPAQSLEDLLAAQQDAQLRVDQHRHAVQQVVQAGSAPRPDRSRRPGHPDGRPAADRLRPGDVQVIAGDQPPRRDQAAQRAGRPVGRPTLGRALVDLPVVLAVAEADRAPVGVLHPVAPAGREQDVLLAVPPRAVIVVGVVVEVRSADRRQGAEQIPDVRQLALEEPPVHGAVPAPGDRGRQAERRPVRPVEQRDQFRLARGHWHPSRTQNVANRPRASSARAYAAGSAERPGPVPSIARWPGATAAAPRPTVGLVRAAVGRLIIGE